MSNLPQTSIYDVDLHAAEIYDQLESYTGDVELICRLTDGSGELCILEPFCGTGRVLIPLAQGGHQVVGLDRSSAMLARARAKLAQLPEPVQRRISLLEADVVREDWPQGFDLVLLGGNCFYELATPQEQERCIASAAQALLPGGHVYVDNDHMEGELAQSWRQPGLGPSFPSGTCSDGTRLESTSEAIWWDAPSRLIRFRRRTRVIFPDGREVEHEFIQQKHPVSQGEVQGWLERHDFEIEALYGDRVGSPYSGSSPRAIFWARRR